MGGLLDCYSIHGNVIYSPARNKIITEHRERRKKWSIPVAPEPLPYHIVVQFDMLLIVIMFNSSKKKIIVKITKADTHFFLY